MFVSSLPYAFLIFSPCILSLPCSPPQHKTTRQAHTTNPPLKPLMDFDQLVGRCSSISLFVLV